MRYVDYEERRKAGFRPTFRVLEVRRRGFAGWWRRSSPLQIYIGTVVALVSFLACLGFFGLIVILMDYLIWG
jgi:hypothetical protein